MFIPFRIFYVKIIFPIIFLHFLDIIQNYLSSRYCILLINIKYHFIDNQQ